MRLAAMSGALLFHVDWGIFSPHAVWRLKASPADGPPQLDPDPVPPL